MSTKLLKKPLATSSQAAVDADYQALAAKLGVGIPANDDSMLDKLALILHNLGITVYSESAVARYLKTKAPEDHQYVWVPAMPQHVPAALRKAHPRFRNEGWRRVSLEGGIITGAVYNKPIPYAVLTTMDQIRTEAIKQGVIPTFFVSDFAKSKTITIERRDPFLAIGTVDSAAFHIIERWDEPGFREDVYSQKRAKKTPIKKASAKK